MRYLAAALLLAACASDPGSDVGDGGPVLDADTRLCPLAGSDGVARASWDSRGGCLYSCVAATHQRCGDRVVDGVIMGGVCVRLDDRQNCGGCGVACGSGESCVKPAGSNFYVCLGGQR